MNQSRQMPPTTRPKTPYTVAGHTVPAFIDDIIAEANADAQIVSTTLRRYERFHGDPAISAEVASSVQELQKTDIFVQKLGHIKKLHEMLTNDSTNKTLMVHQERSIIFQLNYLQTMAACADYLALTTTLAKHLSTLEKHALNANADRNPAKAPFSRRDSMLNNMRYLSEVFSGSYSACNPQGELKPETHEALSNIRSLYSIESERFVLDWLLTNVQGTGTDLLRAYNNRHQGAETPDAEGDIELF